MSEPYLDKKRLAAHYSCSVRWVEYRMAEGLPCWEIAGKAKFRLSEADPWLLEHGHIERRTMPGCTLVTSSTSGPRATGIAGGPTTGGESDGR